MCQGCMARLCVSHSQVPVSNPDCYVPIRAALWGLQAAPASAHMPLGDQNSPNREYQPRE